MIPDRFPSLVVLAGFWIPPAAIGWAVAELVYRSATRVRVAIIFVVLLIFVITYAAVWFAFNLAHIPPYIPGATMDPALASPRAVTNLAIFTAAFVLPASVLACLLAFRIRRRMLNKG